MHRGAYPTVAALQDAVADPPRGAGVTRARRGSTRWSRPCRTCAGSSSAASCRRPASTGARPCSCCSAASPAPDLLLIERAATLRSHAGQPAFPGGAVDPGDGGPVGAALREAQEEVGLDPASVDVLGTLPDLFLPPSGFVVTPVVAWWRAPHPVGVVDTAEVASVVRVPARPAHRPGAPAAGAAPERVHRAGLRHRRRCWSGASPPGVLDKLLAFGGWERPWDRTRSRELDPDVVALARASSPAFDPEPGVTA